MADVTFKMGNITARMAILKAINHPVIAAAAKKGELQLAMADALSMAFALYAPSARVTAAAYFDEQGERGHSAQKWLSEVNAWLDEIGDDGTKALLEQFGKDADTVTPAVESGRE